MGSRKKLVLASLVSLMMALAFVIGLMPLHATPPAMAAGNGSGRIDMVDLLNAVLNVRGGAAPTAIGVTRPASDANVIVPDGTVEAYINFQAASNGDAVPVAYAVNPDLTAGEDLDLIDDLTEGVGPAFGQLPPFNAVLDVNELLGPTMTMLSVYAFANAALDSVDNTMLVYSVRSEPTEFNVMVVSQDTDTDRNGLPAPLTDVVGLGEEWRATYLRSLYNDTGAIVGIGFRNIAIANLNDVPDKQLGQGPTVAPEPGVFVTSPSFGQLLTADLVDENETVYLIVTSCTELQLAISDVYGDNLYIDSAPAAVGGAIAAWADGVEAVAPPQGRMPLLPVAKAAEPSPYVEISLLAVDESGDQYREIETLPDNLPVELELQNLDIIGTSVVQLWSYLSWIQDKAPGAEDFLFTSLGAGVGNGDIAPPSWRFIDQRVPDANQMADSFIAQITSLSIFAAYESAMSIYAVYPESGPTQTVNRVNIVGSFGVAGGTSALDLENQFDVFFGDQLATIASAAAVYDGYVSFEVDAPVYVVPQTVDVSVVDAIEDASLALMEQAYTYYDLYTLNLAVSPGGAGTAVATPNKPTYRLGENVQLVATPSSAAYEFVRWDGDVANLANRFSATTTLNVAGSDLNLQITAVFQLQLEEYFLTVNVNPAGAGTVNQAPSGTGPFDPDQVINLTATPAAGYEFVNWEGPVANPNSATTTVTMTGPSATIVVTAIFEPTHYTLTVIETPDEGGDVTVNPAQATYTPDAAVQLQAFPATGYVFTSWVIGAAVITDNPTTVTMTGPVRDIVVTAMFSKNPVLTVLETEGGTVTVAPAGLSDVTIGGNRFVEYLAGTEVTITAVSGAGFDFVLWEGDVPAPTDVNVKTFTMVADRSVHAVFSSEVMFITSVTPDNAWFFGGVKARILGAGFMPASTHVSVGGTEVDPIAITATEIWFIVPPLPAPPLGQNLEADIAVSNPPYTEAYTEETDFLYKRYETAGGVTTTAFQFDAEDGTLDTPVALNGSLADASLILPVPEQDVDFAYGLVRATTQAALIYADSIYAGTGSSALADAWNFAIHLYDPEVVEEAGKAAVVGEAVYEEITEWTYARSAASTPARLAFETDNTLLNAANIRTNMTMWSIDTLYEYGLNQTTLTGTASNYQSTLTQTEVLPNVLPTTPVDGTPINSVSARLYDLTAFSLRQAAVIPDAILDGVRIDTISGTASGIWTGGTQFTILAPNGGLAWVTVGFAETITDTTPASATTLGTIVNNGASEFSVVVQSPPWIQNEDKIVDVAIYLNGNLDEPVVVLDGGFHYTAESSGDIWRSILLLLLGLGAAIIGLAAGGDSGGGGGGPCFIATAAYGTPMAADIDTLRALRDTYLLESSVGTAFVDAYYHVSPAIAGVIAQSPVLAAIVRLLLLPVIFAAKCVLSMPVVSMLAMGLMVVLAKMRRRGKTSA